MLPSETMIWQPEFTDKTLSRKPGAVHFNIQSDRFRILHDVFLRCSHIPRHRAVPCLHLCRACRAARAQGKQQPDAHG
ncbi:TPA: hypothetical protein HL430_22660 [Escherichia coli]|nr:hypothetical protein [Escherichia coli]